MGALGRVPAFALLVVGVATLAVIAFGGEGGYEVRARFANASQLVEGNLVQVAGQKVGEVTKIKLTDDWQAEVTMRLDEDLPLRQGTEATVRVTSLSGVANRYIDLRMPGAESQRPIPEGGLIDARHTHSAVEIDQLFSALGPKEQKALRNVIRGSARNFRDRAKEAAAGWRYLPPSLSANERLFAELTRNRDNLVRFIIDSSRLATDVADRRDDLAGLGDQLADVTGALSNRRPALDEVIERLPDFMRRANTTFVDLRAALDDVDPLLRESKPAARRLGPLLDELRPLAHVAPPTLDALSRALVRSGADNDLVELTNGNVTLRDIAVGPVQRNGKERRGAFPESTESLRGVRPALAFLRPYGGDLVGWFDDFGHSGIYDALGGASRAANHVSAFALVDQRLAPVPPELRAAVFNQVAARHQNDRCPGSVERRAPDGSNIWRPDPDFGCDHEQVLPGD